MPDEKSPIRTNFARITTGNPCLFQQPANGTKIEDTTPAMEQYIQVARFRRSQWARRDGGADSAALPVRELQWSASTVQCGRL